VQVLEKLHESPGNTNVMKVTARGRSSRQDRRRKRGGPEQGLMIRQGRDPQGGIRQMLLPMKALLG
jgi:hypothetical protein